VRRRTSDEWTLTSISPAGPRAHGSRAWRIVCVLVLLVPLQSGGAAFAQEPQARAYVPELATMTDLMAGSLPGYSIEPIKEDSDATWDVSAAYALYLPGDGRSIVLQVAASVRATDADGFFQARAAKFGSQGASAGSGQEEKVQYGLDDFREGRLVAHEWPDGARRGTYARLARLGRSVASVQASGEADADDAGAIANDRALALVRTFELVVGRMHWYPSDAATDIPGLEPFTRGWSRHGVALSLDATGHGEVRWRVYTWCFDDPTPPCDEMVGSQITSGGWASIAFYHVTGQTAEGVVIGTAQPSVLALGPVTMTLQPYGMATIEQLGRQTVLCGDDYVTLAPDSVRSQSPCGA